eukprot:gene2763-5446_t
MGPTHYCWQREYAEGTASVRSFTKTFTETDTRIKDATKKDGLPNKIFQSSRLDHVVESAMEKLCDLTLSGKPIIMDRRQFYVIQFARMGGCHGSHVSLPYTCQVLLGIRHELESATVLAFAGNFSTANLRHNLFRRLLRRLKNSEKNQKDLISLDSPSCKPRVTGGRGVNIQRENRRNKISITTTERLEAVPEDKNLELNHDDIIKKWAKKDTIFQNENFKHEREDKHLRQILWEDIMRLRSGAIVVTSGNHLEVVDNSEMKENHQLQTCHHCLKILSSCTCLEYSSDLDSNAAESLSSNSEVGMASSDLLDEEMKISGIAISQTELSNFANITVQTKKIDQDSSSWSSSIYMSIIDLDVVCGQNPMYDSTYASSIYAHKKHQENALVHNESVFDGFDQQPEITETMRAILIDWLVEVADENHIQSNTLFLTVHLVDCILLLSQVRKAEFQLLGCACLIIASKLYEQQPPFMSNLVEVAANCFTKEELLEKEQRVMKMLKFDVNLPTRDYFLDRLLLAAEATERESSFVHFLLELSLLDYQYTMYRMSLVASAAVHLSRQILRPLSTTIWTPSLVHYSGYQEQELVEVVQCLQRLHANMVSETMLDLRTIVNKYERSCFQRASHLRGLNPHELRFDIFSDGYNNNTNNRFHIRQSLKRTPPLGGSNSRKRQIQLMSPEGDCRRRKIDNNNMNTTNSTTNNSNNDDEDDEQLINNNNNHVIDLDVICSQKPLYDCTYASSIYAHKKHQENALVHCESVFEGRYQQPEVTETMRAILVDWLVEVADEYHIQSNTLFLTVHLVDCILFISPVWKKEFQLLGCACLIIASKLHEQQPPFMANLVEVAAYCFTIEELLEKEQRVMKMLKFDVNLPTRDYFLDRLLLAAEATERESSFVHFLLELSLLDYQYTMYRMSLVASAAIHLSRQILRPLSTTIWTPSLVHYSGYQEQELVEVVQCLQRLHANMVLETNGLKAVGRKYERCCHHRVARIFARRPEDLRHIPY